MELIDVLTSDGVRTGRTKPKADVHRDGDWHFASHVWLVAPDKRVLLQRRSTHKENWPDRWDISVAGHVSAGESAVDCAIREAHEELGLSLRAADLTHLDTLRWHAVLNEGAYIENEFHEVFIASREIDLARLVLDPEEVADVALVRPDEIERYDVVPHDEEYALLRRYLNPGATGS
ncbi:MAG TPA: NUDIX domain-containing protein [Thermoanaerobaculia bacterium]|nr:NUDIX domain-containing protein [Thermoanaerobaculia bacterium]